MLILRHLMPNKEEAAAETNLENCNNCEIGVLLRGKGDSPMASVAKGATGKAKEGLRGVH